MGRSSRRRAAMQQIDSSDTESVDSISTAMSELMVTNETEYINSQDFLLEKYIDDLYEKRGSVREMALVGLVEAFQGQVLLQSVDNKCITLLHQFINSIKRGSVKEACLASRALGLLSITVGAGSTAHEIMEEFVSELPMALISGSEALKKSSVLDCLAVVTFVGANDLSQTEASLKIIWQVIHPKSGSNVGSVKKPTAAVLAPAISAWSFLLTTVSGWRINLNDWKESITYLSTLLEDNDRSVRIAAGEALVILFEMGAFEMYQIKDASIDSLDNDATKNGLYLYMRSLRAKILEQVNALSVEAAGKGSDKKNLNEQRDLFQKIINFVQNDECPEVALKISSKHGFLKTSTWVKMIQLNFFKRFLAKGFLKHAQDNELLHEIFYFEQDKMGSLSSKEKKMSRTGDEKWRTLKMNRDRRTALVRKQVHLIAQDA